MLSELGRWQRENAALAVAVWYHVALLIFAVVALPFDRRVILGLNPWIKPLKFDVSTLVFLVTMAGILSGIEGWRRSRTTIGAGIAVAMMVENTIISMQSLRGVRSHMNYATAADALAFAVMGLFIALNTALVAWALGLCCTRRLRWPRAVAWGVRLGLLALVAGSLEGVTMVAHGAHTVGAVDGLAGLPLLNWSRGHGDLRVAHFFALHALQAMPLQGWAVSRTRWTSRGQVAAVCAGFVGYMGGVWMLFAQAMAGRPSL